MVIRLLADQNIVGLDCLPAEDVEVTAVPGRTINAKDLRGIDALWVRSVTPVNAKLLGESGVSFVGTATAGVEHIDLPYLHERGIAFSSAPGANANAVVEYVLTALVTLGTPWEALEGGASLGIVGYGAVGRRLAAVAQAMGWRVRVSDPPLEAYSRAVRSIDSLNERSLGDGDLSLFAPLEEVLRCSVVSLHCALVSDSSWPTYHLLGDREFEHLDASQWLINASRGEVIDTAALRAHLRRPRPVNCVLDVWESEPDIAMDLLASPSLHLGTPHIAGYSWDAKWHGTRMLWESMQAEGLVQRILQSGKEETPKPLVLSGTAMSELATIFAQRYQIRKDDQALRAIASLTTAKRACAFDALRREYPMRRELRGSSVQLRQGKLTEDAERICAALGLGLVVT